MKKTILLLFSVALVALVSCQKENLSSQSGIKFAENGIVLQAAMETPADDAFSKTTIAGTTVEWQKDIDAIKLFDVDGRSVKLVATASGQTVSFREVEGTREDGFDEENIVYAAYPYDAVVSYATQDGIKINVDSVQQYAENTFGSGANISVAKLDENNLLRFKNACGILKIELLGTGTVHQILLTGKNDEVLGGTCFVNPESANPYAVMSGDGPKTITLNCGSGVILKKDIPTSFFIVAPHGAFANGFSLKVNGKYSFDNISTVKNNVINRSTIRKMSARRSYVLPDDYVLGEYVSSSGAQYVIGPEVNAAETTCEIGFAKAATTQSGVSVFGATDGVEDGSLKIYFKDNKFRCHMYPNMTPELVAAPVGERINVVINKKDGDDRISLINGVLHNRVENYDNTFSTKTPYIFCHNEKGTDKGHSSVHVYEVKYYPVGGSSDELSHYLIPAKEFSTGHVGFFDAIEGSFYRGEGTAELAFNSADVPSTYEAVKCIITDGTQYIEGPTVTPADITAEIKFALGNTTKKDANVFGSVSDNTKKYRYLVQTSNGGVYLGLGDLRSEVKIESDTEYVVEIGKKSDKGRQLIWNGSTVILDRSLTSPISSLSPCLVGNNLYGTYKEAVTSLKIMYIKYYSYETGELLYDFEPVVQQPSGIAGLYDSVHDVFYKQAIGNAFTYITLQK